MNPERFHLTLAVEGRPGVRVTLVDEVTGAVLTTWPEEP